MTADKITLLGLSPALASQPFYAEGFVDEKKRSTRERVLMEIEAGKERAEPGNAGRTVLKLLAVAVVVFFGLQVLMELKKSNSPAPECVDVFSIFVGEGELCLAEAALRR